MVKTIQRKITSVYSFWLFIVFIAMIIYVLFIKGQAFMAYEEAVPWILGYIALSVIGNLGMLYAMYRFLVPSQDSLKFLAAYEIIFVVILISAFLTIQMEVLPAGGFGNMNFETLLNAVLPLVFILQILDEFILSKALRMMPCKEV
ncbi:MAG: hypothetical protein LBU81_07860 [Methanosarcinales archaeon]|jgi:hypothetical protein|nr:hypothetical protein [Methanosarcinales archaeon]